MEPGGLGWLDGFDEFLVRCGLESNGAPDFGEQGLAFPLHGRIATRPAYRLEVQADGAELRLIGEVEEIRFHFLKLRMTTTYRLRPDSRTLQIEDRIQNLSASPAATQMLYHVNFGAPLLDAGAQVVAAAETVVPRNPHAAAAVHNWSSYAAAEPGFEEQVYFLKLKSGADQRTETLLRNAHGTLGASLHFDVRQLPCFTVWKNTTAVEDGYVTGLEPGTNFPNPRSFEAEQGRVRSIAPQADTRYQLDIQCHADARAVSQAEQRIARLQGDQPPQLADRPLSDWCAD
jgi:hypothetical protein